MQNPFDVNTNADSALMGGASAESALGFPSQRPQAGIRTPHYLVQQAQDRLQALRTQQTAPQAPVQNADPVIGYNPQTDTLWSAGVEFDAGNLSEIDSATKSGLLARNNATLPPGFGPVKASMIQAEMKQRAQDRGVGHVASEAVKELGVGVASIPQMALKSAAFYSPAGSAVEKGLSSAADAFDVTRRTPDVYGLGSFGTGVVDAAGSLAPSLAAGIASYAAPVVGTAVATGILGGSQAYDTYKRGLEAGLTPEAARAAAIKTGAIEGVGEIVADRAGVGLMKNAGRAIGPMLKGSVGYAPRVATDLLANSALQTGTEFGQGYAQGAIERDAGITTDDPMEQATRGAWAGLAQSAFMAPFGAASAYRSRPRNLLKPDQEPPAPEAPIAPPADLHGPVPNLIGPVQPEPTMPLPEGAQANIFGNYDSNLGRGTLPNQEADYVTPEPTFDEHTADMFPEEAAVETVRALPDYLPEEIAAAIKPPKSRSKTLDALVTAVTDALGDSTKTNALLAQLELGTFNGRELASSAVEGAVAKLEAFQNDLNAARAEMAQRNAVPGQRVGISDETLTQRDAQTQADLIAQSDAQLDEETTPDTIPSTPNEMDVESLIPERGPKGPASTLVLRGQTQSELDELNAREQWLAGPQDRPAGPAAVAPNQLAMFDLKGQPTNPAVGAPLPTSAPAPAPAPAPVAPKRPRKTKAQATQVNADLGTPQTLPQEPPSQQEKLLRDRFKKLEGRRDYAIENTDALAIQAALEQGRLDDARQLISRIEADMRDGRYRSTPTAGPKKASIGREKTLAIVDRVLRALGMTGKVKVNVVSNGSEMGLTDAAAAEAFGFTSKSGEMYLFSDNMTSELDVLKTLFHEMFHAGLSRSLKQGAYIQAMLKFKADALVRRYAKNWKASADGQERVGKMPTNNYEALAVEEALAKIGEDIMRGELGTKDVQPFVRNVVRWLANLADEVGLTKAAQALRRMTYTEAEAFVFDTIAGLDYAGKSLLAKDRFRLGTSAFRRWFGNSKVVDKDGKPLVVYHGTPPKGKKRMLGVNEPFFVFDKALRGTNTSAKSAEGGFFFGNLMNAAHYAGGGGMGNLAEFVKDLEYANEQLAKMGSRDKFNASRWDTQVARKARAEQVLAEEEAEGLIMPVYLSIQNPLVYDFGGTGYREITYAELIARAKAKGHDGVVLKNTADPYEGDIYVVFEPTQIKSATGNNGNYDPENPDIRYRQRESTTQEQTPPRNMAAKDTPPTIAEKLKYTAIQAGRRSLLSTMFLRDLVETYARKFTRVKEVETATFKMADAAGRMQEAAIAVQDKINALSATEKNQLFDFMSLVLDAEVAIDDKTDMSPNAVMLRNRFEKELNDAQRTAYRAARDGLKENWKKRGKLLTKTADEVFDPLIEQANAAGNTKQVRQLEREKSAFIDETNARLKAIKGDYFPSMRFGDWSVVRKSAAYEAAVEKEQAAYAKLNLLLDKHDKQTPTERKANARAAKAMKDSGQEPISGFTPKQTEEINAAREAYDEARAAVEEMKQEPENYYSAQFETRAEAEAHARSEGGYISHRSDAAKEATPVSRQMLKRLEESMETTLRGSGNVNSLRDAKRAMYEVYLSSLPEVSALKRQAKRKKVGGYHSNMQRNIAAAMLRDSFYLSRMEYVDDLNSAVASVRQEADAAAARRDPNGIKMQDVAAELERRHSANFSYVETPIQDLATATTYVYFLGISPGFLIANLMQPLMVSLPMVAARFGAKTFTAASKAYADTARLVSQSIKKDWKGEIDFKSAKDLNAAEKTMLENMLVRRLLNVTLVHDLSTMADGKTTSKWTRAISTPSHHVEVVNRIATALTAYRLELARTRDPALAEIYAAKVLADTHFDYSTENAPYWMKPGVVPTGKILFQFKKYMLGMLSLYVKTVKATTRPEDRAEAFRTLIGLYTTHGAIAGALGMPLAGTAMMIAQAVASAWGDEPEDMESAARVWLTNQVGPTAATAILKGLPTLVDIDVSKKLGAGDMGNPLSMMRDTDGGRALYLEALATLAGPTIGGLLPRFADGATFMAQGDMVRAAESFVPKFIADPIRAGRFASEGVKTRSGDTMREQSDMWEAFLQASGLPVSDVNTMYEQSAAIRKREDAMADWSRSLQRKWVDGDPAERREIEKKLRDEINPERQRLGLKPITRADLMRAQNRRNDANENYQTRGANTRNDKLAESFNFG